jgi:hypothetical protein
MKGYGPPAPPASPGCAGLATFLRLPAVTDPAGVDVVDVLPELDSSHITATLAATAAYEILTLIACARAAAGRRDGTAS